MGRHKTRNYDTLFDVLTMLCSVGAIVILMSIVVWIAYTGIVFERTIQTKECEVIGMASKYVDTSCGLLEVTTQDAEKFTSLEQGRTCTMVIKGTEDGVGRTPVLIAAVS